MSEIRGEASGQKSIFFGRSEQGQAGILWTVYAAAHEGDFKEGQKVCSFARREDARDYCAWMNGGWEKSLLSEADLARLRAAAEAVLRSARWKVGHWPWCNFYGPRGGACICGEDEFQHALGMLCEAMALRETLEVKR